MKILIVDDHALMRSGMKFILQRAHPGSEVQESGSAAETIRLVHESQFDLILLDLELPDRNGLEVLVDIRLASPQVPILVISGLPELEFGYRAIKAGASGFVSKTEASDVLETAAQKLLNGGRYISAKLAERLAQSLQFRGEHLHDNLSEREFQILVMIASGQAAGEIAEKLSLSVKTVSTYRTRLLKKMGLSTNAELMRYAFDHGIAK